LNSNSKNILITGVSSGIGRALAQFFFEKEFKVIGLDINRDEQNNYQEYCHNFYQIDISNYDQVLNLRDSILASYSHIGCLINNAAIQVEKSLIDTSLEEWSRVLNTNLSSAFYITKSFFPMLKGGSILNISSVHARATSRNLASYVASKGGLSALTRAMALELADYNIRVNSILPGAIETEMLVKGLSRNYNADEARKSLVKATPLKKIGKPRDIAQLAYFLADSEMASNITGQEFICDGGVLARLDSE
jgi:NAD(P)-dependent dehydrogenase (short-subunit alcohol dehydrogenase family)